MNIKNMFDLKPILKLILKIELKYYKKHKKIFRNLIKIQNNKTLKLNII